MSNNSDTIKILHIDKLIIKKYVKVDFLEENTGVVSATIPELVHFLLTSYLKQNYDKLKHEIENELNTNKHTRPN